LAALILDVVKKCFDASLLRERDGVFMGLNCSFVGRMMRRKCGLRFNIGGGIQGGM